MVHRYVADKIVQEIPHHDNSSSLLAFNWMNTAVTMISLHKGRWRTTLMFPFLVSSMKAIEQIVNMPMIWNDMNLV